MRRSRIVRRGGPAVLAAVVLAAPGCGSGAGRSAATTVPKAGPTATVRFGFLGALSGPSGSLGSDIANGERLAVSQFDAVDPPVKVAIDVVDTGGDPSRAKSGAERLAADRVVAVVGPTFGDEVSVAEPILEQAGIPSVTVSAAERDLAARGWRFFHRVIPDDALQGQAIADFLVKNLHATTVAMIDDSSPSSRALAVSAEETVNGGGAEVVASYHLDGRPGDVAAAVAGVTTTSPGAVFFAGASGTAARLAAGLRSAGFSGKFLAGGSDASGFIAAGGPATAGGSYVVCACAAIAQNPNAQAFIAAYLAQFGSAPGAYSAEAYDVTSAILQAVKAGDLTPAAINGFLSNSDYSGITRTVRFVPDGDWAGDTMYLYKVESGQAVPVAESGQT